MWVKFSGENYEKKQFVKKIKEAGLAGFSLEFTLIDYSLITTQSELDTLLSSYKKASVLYIDTEFVRQKTFYAQLGLIQVFDGKSLGLIDPLCDLNLEDFWLLLKNQQILKVLHSGNEDLEIFAHYGGCQPTPYFDTQIAASLTGKGHSLGYAALVYDLLQKQVDKSESRTDWLARPLREAQLQYAANDVFFLEKIYLALKKDLEIKGRYEWVLEESQLQTKNRLEPINPEFAYLDVKNAYKLNVEQLAILKSLASWRIKKAMAEDKALGFIAKDLTLFLIAQLKPTTKEDILNIEDIHAQEKKRYSQDFFQCVLNADLDHHPEKIYVLFFEPRYKKDFKKIKDLLIECAEKNELPIEMLGSKKLIHQYLKWFWNKNLEETQPLLMQGWRKKVSVSYLKQLKA